MLFICIKKNIELSDLGSMVINLDCYFTFRRTNFDIDFSKNVFIITYYGKEKIDNIGQFKKYMHALSTTVPGATVIFSISEFTTIDQSFYSYDLNLNIEKYGNETISSLSKKYPDTFQHYYVGLRYNFYADYFESHPEIEYAIFSDVDMLFLKNPFELMRENPEEVHFMYDYKPFSRKTDNNYKWTNAWITLNKDVQRKCGITVLNKTLDDPSIQSLIP